MNMHQNARTTVHSRALIVFRVLEEKQPPGEVAADFGVSGGTTGRTYETANTITTNTARVLRRSMVVRVVGR